jgi:hypothetical protein
MPGQIGHMAEPNANWRWTANGQPVTSAMRATLVLRTPVSRSDQVRAPTTVDVLEGQHPPDSPESAVGWTVQPVRAPTTA